MNERIQELIRLSAVPADQAEDYAVAKGLIEPTEKLDVAKFAELIVAKVLDEVAERAYICGDRAWSDEMDRRWIELEFGFGELAELKNGRE